MSKLKPFACNFHAHSDHSTIDGGSSVKTIVKRAKELQYQHIVLTEHGNINSAATLGMHATEEKIRFSHGIEAYLDTPFDKLGIPPSEDNYKRDYSHVTILFKSTKAYLHFCKLTPVMEERAVYRYGERKPILKWEELEEIGSEIVFFDVGYPFPIDLGNVKQTFFSRQDFDKGTECNNALDLSIIDIPDFRYGNDFLDAVLGSFNGSFVA